MISEMSEKEKRVLANQGLTHVTFEQDCERLTMMILDGEFKGRVFEIEWETE